MSESPSPDHPLVGTWEYDKQGEEWGETDAVFTVSVSEGLFNVVGYDEGDGESFEISDVSWDGEWLRFGSFMPSTGWRVRHGFRSTGPGQLDDTGEAIYHGPVLGVQWTR